MRRGGGGDAEESLQLQQLGLGRLEAGDRLGSFSMNLRKKMTCGPSSPIFGEVEGVDEGKLPPRFFSSLLFLLLSLFYSFDVVGGKNANGRGRRLVGCLYEGRADRCV